ncbi:retrovirus-related pol polyprotein from transposon TNT 1-94 [Tanacetum coccineum]
MTVAGARDIVGGQVVQQSRIQCFNYKEFAHFAKECRKPKQAIWPKIQEVPNADSDTDSEIEKAIGFKWVPKNKKLKWVPKLGIDSVQKKVSFAIDNASRITNIIQLILFIVDSGCTKHMTGNLSLLCNFVEKYLGTVHFGNDQFALILSYGDLVQGNITINRVYYVKGLNHNLFSVGQFCDADLEEGIEHQTSTPRTPEQNGVVKRQNRTLVEDARTMLLASKLPLFFWAEAIATACYTQNKLSLILTHEETAISLL